MSEKINRIISDSFPRADIKYPTELLCKTNDAIFNFPWTGIS